MNPASRALSAEEIEAHQKWVRSLARSLLTEAEAEDLAQDVWAAAIEKPPGSQPGGSLRPWLSKVARNLARRTLRQQLREVEAKVSSAPRMAPDPASLLMRAEAHRKVVEAVLGLEEPFRTALLLRFFEHMNTVETARHLNLHPTTIRHRIQRGLEILRWKLRESDGDFRQTCLAVLGIPPALWAGPAGSSPRPWASLSAGKLAAGLILAGGVVFGVATLMRDGGPAPAAAPDALGSTPALSRAAAPPVVSLPPVASLPGRSLLPVALPALRAPSPPAPQAGPTVQVRFRTPDGGSFLQALRPRITFPAGRLGVVATVEPVSGPLTLSIYPSATGNPDNGAWIEESSRGPDPLPLGFDGEVTLPGSGPVHLTATFGNLILDSQVYDPAQGDGTVTFVLSPEALFLQLHSVTLHFVDSVSGDPLSGEVDLWTAMGENGRKALAADGSVTFADIDPGYRKVLGRFEGHEAIDVPVRIPRGGDVDLGTFAIPPRTTISGRLIGPDGQPLDPQRTFIYYRDPRLIGDGCFSDAGGLIADLKPDGTFLCWGSGVGTQLLQFGGWDTGQEAVLVDTSNGPVTDLVLQLHQGSEVTLQPKLGPTQTRRIVIREEASGLPVWSVSLEGMRDLTLRLAPGIYKVECAADDGVHWIKSLDVRGDPVGFPVDP